MSNIVLVGAIDEDLKQIGLAFAQKLDFFYLNCEDMIAYSLFDEEKMKKVCGIKYAEEQEKKVISGLNLYEKTIISMNCETYLNNIDAISQNNIVIYLRQTPSQFNKRLESLKKFGISKQLLGKYEIMQLVFKERDNYLKKNCNFFVKYDISKLDDLIETLESLTSELK